MLPVSSLMSFTVMAAGVVEVVAPTLRRVAGVMKLRPLLLANAVGVLVGVAVLERYSLVLQPENGPKRSVAEYT